MRLRRSRQSGREEQRRCIMNNLSCIVRDYGEIEMIHANGERSTGVSNNG